MRFFLSLIHMLNGIHTKHVALLDCVFVVIQAFPFVGIILAHIPNRSPSQLTTALPLIQASRKRLAAAFLLVILVDERVCICFPFCS